MTALAADRLTPFRMNDFRSGPVAANVKIFAGALVMRNAAGYLTKGATATGAVGCGRAEAVADNTGGAAGEASVTFRSGTFCFDNSGGADAITFAEVGKLCYIVDDQTVAKTDGTGTRSRAGFVDGVEGRGVWVRMDEALTRSA